jgi:hypothetical protein
MNELLPVTFGLVIGAVMGRVTARQRPWLWLVASIVLGVAATYLTGEWKASWEYVLVDIPLVAISSAVGYLLVRAWTRRAAEPPESEARPAKK